MIKIDFRIPINFRIANRYISRKDLDILFCDKKMKEPKIDIGIIVEEQEQAINYICEHLELKKVKGITIRLHNDRFKTIFGDYFQGGYANYYYKIIEQSMPTVKSNRRLMGFHEMTHILVHCNLGYSNSH